MGTLIAILLYFRKEVVRLASAGGRKCLSWQTGGQVERQADARLAWFLIFATLPAGLAGLFLGKYVEALSA